MRLQYDSLFYVELTHAYFSSGRLADVEIEPTPLCLAALRDGGLLFKKTSSGFGVVYEYRAVGSDRRFPVRSLRDPMKLSFFLKSKDPHLLSYSSLPLNGPDKGIYSFNNLTKNVRGGKHLLTSDVSSSYTTAKDLVALWPQRFQYSVSGDRSAHTVTVSDALDRPVMTLPVAPSDHPTGCDINLRKHSPGRYVLAVDGEPLLDFYADDHAARQRPFGVIDIFMGTGVPSGFSSINADGSVTSNLFTIAVDRRSLYWRYFLVLKYRAVVSPDDITILHPDPAISFVRGAATTMADGTSVVPFVSNRELPLQSKAVTGITLQKSGNGSGAFSVENLPNASFENVVPDIAAGRVYSDVYVYI